MPDCDAESAEASPILGTSLWTGGGQLVKLWGLTKSLGDNYVDTKIPLDLGLCVRECMPRTGKRVSTGAERPSLQNEDCTGNRAAEGSGKRTQFTRRKRFRSEREAMCS